MAGLHERVAFVERRMNDHATLLTDLRTDMRDMRVELRTEMREMRSEMRDLRSEMDRRFDRVDQKFTWLVGVFVAVLLGLVSLSLQISRLQQL